LKVPDFIGCSMQLRKKGVVAELLANPLNEFQNVISIAQKLPPTRRVSCLAKSRGKAAFAASSRSAA